MTKAPLFAALWILAASPLVAGERPVDARALDAFVRGALAEHGGGAAAGIWIGGAAGGPAYAWEADAVRPSASAIKTSFLIELFAKFAGKLDEAPLGLGEILRDDHPAIAHFAPDQREEIRKGLAGASSRKIGKVMMGSERASNIVYNAAANVAIALLGGPEGLTKAIHARDPAFSGLVVRRYMLAPRNVTGDNEATPVALAAVMQRLASGVVPGLDAAVVGAIRDAILDKDGLFGLAGRHRVKDGALNSDPLTFVHCGWWEPASGPPIVYAVMVAQPGPAGRPRDEAGTRLGELAGRLAQGVVKAVGPSK